MSSPKLSSLFDIGVDILKTVLSKTTGLITAQTGDVVSKTVNADGAEWWQHVGFVSRPAVPTAGQAACQGIAIKRSDNDAIIATRDARGSTIYGSLADGESCIYSPGAQGRVLLKADGSVNIYTTSDNTGTGQSVILTVAPGAVSIGTPWGALVMDSNGIRMGAGSAGIQVGSDGTVTIIGTKIALNGGSVSLGATASPTNTILFGPSGLAAIPSTSVFVSL